MKAMLLVLLMMFAAPVLAQTNVYFSTDEVGQGITVYNYNDLSGDENTLFYIYTYGGGFSGQDQRWFVGNGAVQKGGDTLGKLYQTEGYFYPIGGPCQIPFQNCVGQNILVGYFFLRPNPEGEGYLLWVEPLEGDEVEPKEDLPWWDRILERIFVFDTPLLANVITK